MKFTIEEAPSTVSLVSVLEGKKNDKALWGARKKARKNYKEPRAGGSAKESAKPADEQGIKIVLRKDKITEEN